MRDSRGRKQFPALSGYELTVQIGRLVDNIRPGAAASVNAGLTTAVHRGSPSNEADW